MNHRLEDVVLRRPEPKDLEALYQQKNDPDVARLLGGFSTGYSRADIADWIEHHRKLSDEVLWLIVGAEEDRCLGHVGLYQIDYRIGRAEFAIMLGDKSAWGHGIGKKVSHFALSYGFEMLNLNRIELNFLETNTRARKLYESLGFRQEGVLRQAQFKDGRHINVVLMSILQSEFRGHQT